MIVTLRGVSVSMTVCYVHDGPGVLGVCFI